MSKKIKVLTRYEIKNNNQDLYSSQLNAGYDFQLKNGNYLVLHGDMFEKQVFSEKRIPKIIFKILSFFTIEIITVITEIKWWTYTVCSNLFDKIRKYFGIKKKPFKFFIKIWDSIRHTLNSIHHLYNYIFIEKRAVKFAKQKGYVGIICGHTHVYKSKIHDNGIHYINSGTWLSKYTVICIKNQKGKFFRI